MNNPEESPAEAKQEDQSITQGLLANGAQEDHASAINEADQAVSHLGARVAADAAHSALTDVEQSDEETVRDNSEPRIYEDLLEGEPLDTEEITCLQSRISSIPALFLSRFQHLIRLCLRQNVIRTIEGLDPVARTLSDLDLYDNHIGKVQGLDALTNLTSLDLSFNKIHVIQNLDKLTKLEDLYFVANKISVIEGVGHLTKLRSLELGSNRIRELRGLDSLLALERLWVAKNKITRIAGLANLKNLRLLSIQANRISDLSPLAASPQLEELYVSNNALTTVAGLCHNVNLRIVDIGNNAIASLNGLGPLSRVEEVWASYNKIADFGELDKYLADKVKLNTVYFEHCPLQTKGPALYRNKVRLALPQIQQIDATYVTFSS